MSGRLRIFAALSVLAAACSSAGNGPPVTDIEAPPTTVAGIPQAATTQPVATFVDSTIAEGEELEAECLLPDVRPYRSRWSESAEGYATEVLREIHGDNAHWVFRYIEPEEDAPGFQSNIIIGDDTWRLDDGAWEEFPVTPIRWPLLVWVNGYVNGPDVARFLEPGERDQVAGVPATVYRGGIAEMTEAFPGKMRGREFMPDGTRYQYWVDDCGGLLRAEVQIELAGEERAIADRGDFPPLFFYSYVVYDVGAEFDIIPPPGPEYLPEIEPPAS